MLMYATDITLSVKGHLSEAVPGHSREQPPVLFPLLCFLSSYNTHHHLTLYSPCWLVHCLSFWLECTLHEGRYFCLFYPFLFSPELNPVPDTCLVLKKSIQRSPGICRGLVSGLPLTPKSMDAQVLYMKVLVFACKLCTSSYILYF